MILPPMSADAGTHSSVDTRRLALLGHRGAVVWLTGRPAAGKSTLAAALEERLLRERIVAAIVDGDALRSGLSRDLGFSDADRRENVRRAAELALALAQAGVVAIVALISPFREDREAAAARARERGVRFAEVFVNAPLAVCEQRDPKGLYRKARAGQVRAFTGIDSPYEPPSRPELELRTDVMSVHDCSERLTRLALALARPGVTA